MESVLHEGPAPGRVARAELRRIRADYIAAQGWATFDAALHDLTDRDATLSGAHHGLTLWFEADLYDQLQLLQVLADLQTFHVPAHTISVVCIDARVGLDRWIGGVQLEARDMWRYDEESKTIM